MYTPPEPRRRRNRRSGICGLLLVPATLLLCAGAPGQSMTVIGNSDDGRNCFARAELAVTLNAADERDADVCHTALEDVNLPRSDRAATLVNLGILQSAAGQYEKAKASYDAALALADDKGETHINIANIYVRQKRYREAVEEYTRGIQKKSRRLHVAYLNRGLAYEYMKEYAAARADYTRALDLSPEWLRARKMLARVEIALSENQ